ncbi:DUF6458 family protein [Microbacterium sp. H1-D42]|uniref:DUF6458 family protein n=1 Tax=Microbacterium sp. H1-D42 TaxID=2925844 RepID=UPI001F539C04|nr:DUF6458 family protein [Microbacterium sp. H1-D42]UNK70399.1 DUF6458 family protein [Microbacterium sp. H1-D42]
MSIGTGIVLFVIGAILTFALNVDVAWADLDLIGYILMGAGVVVFLVGIVMMARRRRTDVVTRTDAAPDGSYETRRSTRAPGPDDGMV